MNGACMAASGICITRRRRPAGWKVDVSGAENEFLHSHSSDLHVIQDRVDEQLGTPWRTLMHRCIERFGNVCEQRSERFRRHETAATVTGN